MNVNKRVLNSQPSVWKHQRYILLSFDKQHIFVLLPIFYTFTGNHKEYLIYKVNGNLYWISGIMSEIESIERVIA